MSLSVLSLAVQANYCPGPGRRLCCRSAGGPCPTVPAGQRNSQAAFLNSVPIVTLAKQTVKGEKVWGRMKTTWAVGTDTDWDTCVVQCCSVFLPWPSQLLLNQFGSDVLLICFNYFFFVFFMMFWLFLFVCLFFSNFLFSLIRQSLVTTSHWDNSIEWKAWQHGSLKETRTGTHHKGDSSRKLLIYFLFFTF